MRTFLILVLLLGATLGAAAQSASDTGSGRRVDFSLTPFRDTLFAGVDGAFRARFDDASHVWYSTEGGVVHVDPFNRTRELYTRFEGLPSSYAIGLDVSDRHVYVGTDLGLGVIDRVTGDVQQLTPLNTPLQDAIIQEVHVVGDEVWLGTRFFGVAVWNRTMAPGEAGAWTFKNTSTTAGYANAVRRIEASPTAVWVATEGDGAWRYDRATGRWNVTVKADGLPTNNVLSVAERGSATWFGTDRGLSVRSASGGWTHYNKTQSGMPDDRVLDIDIIPTLNGTLDVFASTRRGVWQLEPETGRNGTRAQSFGILGHYVLDSEFVANQGWLFATTRGISMLRDGTWSYFATGPSTGPSWGPLAFGFTSASVGDADGWLWFGSPRGASAYRLPSGGNPGWWQNFGEWQNWPGSVVNWIDTNGNVTWFGTNSGTYGFEHDTGRWIPKLSTGSRNLVYGLDAVDNELWIALFGDGLVMEDLDTGVVRVWDHTTALAPLPDQHLTDVRVDGGNVWLGAGVGVIQLDRVSGTIRNTFTRTDGLPGDGVVFRVEPDGPIVWVGTKDGGVAKLDVAAGKVTRVWNATNSPGFPDGQVRSLHRESTRLWVGTTEGLARIDLATGRVRSWNQSNSDLVQNYINGISSAGGVLYLGTLSGVHRMQIEDETFFPLWDGPGVIRASADGGAAGPSGVTVRIESPRDGKAVTGVTEVRGSAFAFGGKVDRVEVRVGEGPWAAAQGTESWSYEWDTTELAPGEPVALAARAFAGNATGETRILVTPVAPPKIPLTIEELASESSAFANRPLKFLARVDGDEPLQGFLYYRPPGASSYARLEMARQGSLFAATIPARDMREGELRYYMEATSGLLVANAAGDAARPTLLDVGPAPRLAVAVDAPVLVEANAGEATSFSLNVTNAGTQPATFTLSAAGLRSAWVRVPVEDLALEPGETRAVAVRLDVPAAAFADETSITFEARDRAGVADPATASVPVRIHAAAPITTPDAPPSPQRSPIPLAPAVALAAVAVAVVLRGRRS